MAWAVDLSWLVAACALVLSAAVLVIFRRLGPALHVLLDLLLAAGLLRLSADASWDVIAVAAVVIALRRVLAATLLGRTAEPVSAKQNG
ncbi:hypothetical protein [Mycobacterium sp. IDR2000157661]|uniref:hypothetical protein n=1 Tax=Mycobacterium sp. IDR2000157661 TaxID=2867005 RepID=UPI001EEAE516|nr:hypothetical protein [Mycobacterium sp. IDR2000157661]ULE34502.1 hypothetical protein K3G64_07770 [Mycobacterium sp. IDR2000157661]